MISNAALGNRNAKALVYVAGFAPERGESALQRINRLLGSTLAETLVSFSFPAAATTSASDRTGFGAVRGRPPRGAGRR